MNGLQLVQYDAGHGRLVLILISCRWIILRIAPVVAIFEALHVSEASWTTRRHSLADLSRVRRQVLVAFQRVTLTGFIDNHISMTARSIELFVVSVTELSVWTDHTVRFVAY